ncbi:MAG: SDR family NAD(P)-dependent oxidoreductase [Myxococcota bacterium]
MKRTALVTGANSGLGFEAAAQLAEAGYGRVILACRTLEKAEGARQRLVERVGHDPFETLAIDVADLASSHAAADTLLARDQPIHALLLNAGLVPGETLTTSKDGHELSFAASVVGHHVSAWWSAALARRLGDRAAVFTVSPGSNLSTNAARHTRGLPRFLFTKVMPAIGSLIGWDQPVSAGARRYLDVLESRDTFVSGRTYTSAPGKMVGALHEVTMLHITDVERQETAWDVLTTLTGVGFPADSALTPASLV